MKNFRTYNLALTLYRQCENKKIRSSVVRDQFKRASLIIVLNLAEGYRRDTSKDRKKFYSIALGSLRETQGLLQILNWQDEAKTADRLGSYLYKLLQNPGGR